MSRILDKGNREYSWDFVKTVLMFFVVFGHLCPAGDEWTPVTRIIGLFAIPGFFFVSGYFQSQVEDLSGLFRKMQRLFMRIVLPMLSWGTIYVFLSSIQLFRSGEITNANEYFQFIKYFPIYAMGIYWFFTALILCVIVGSIMFWLIEKKKLIGLSLMLASPILFCIVSPNFFERYHFSFVWFFYVLGMLYRHVAERFSFSNQIWKLLFGGLFLIIVIIGVNFEPQRTFYYESNLICQSSTFFVLKRYMLYLAATSSVIYGLIWFYRMFKENMRVKQWASYGADTLFVYCSHVLILVLWYRPFVLPYLYHEHASWTVCILEHVIGLFASVLIYYLMQRLCLYCKQFRWLRVLLMGSK